MSRIGRKPINIPAGVTVTVDAGVVTVKGPKGTLSQTFQPRARLTMQPVRNSNVVIPTAPMRICCHNGICQGRTSLINPRNTKQIPPSKNMVQ